MKLNKNITHKVIMKMMDIMMIMVIILMNMRMNLTQNQTNTMVLLSKHAPFRHYYLVKKQIWAMPVYDNCFLS